MTKSTTLSRYLRPGSRVVVAVAGAEAAKIEGRIVEIAPDFLVLDADGTTHILDLQSIQRFTVVEPAPTAGAPGGGDAEVGCALPPTAHASRSESTATSLTDRGAQVDPRDAGPNPPSSNVVAEAAPAAAPVTERRSVAEWPSVFSGSIVLQPPAPDFAIVGLSRDDHAEVVRAKNRYEYARKVGELDRVVSDVKALARLAERLRDARLFRLAGALASIANRTQDSKAMYREAIRFGGTTEDHAAMAYLHSRDEDWEAVAHSILKAVPSTPSDTNVDASRMLVLGRALSRLSDRELPGLASVLSASMDGEAMRLARLLLSAVLVGRSDHAARVAATGDLTAARDVAPSSRVFEPSAATNESTPSGRVSVEGLAPATNDGRILAFYPDHDYGYVSRDGDDRTFWFDARRAVPDDLRQEFLRGRSAFRVRFRPLPPAASDQLRRYPAAEIISILERLPPPIPQQQSESLAPRATTKPIEGRLIAAFHRARRAAELGDFDEAKALYREEIDSKGQYRPSAIKDYAWLLSRLGEFDPALELLRSHRGDFADSTSIDNLEIEILRRARRWDDAVSKLEDMAVRYPRQSGQLRRQLAYLLWQAGRPEQAMRALDTLPASMRNDQEVAALRKRFSTPPDIGDDRLIEGGVGLSSRAEFFRGITSFGRQVLESSELRGVEEPSKTAGTFTRREFDHVEEQLRQMRGRQPREAAELLLTLAVLCDRAPHAAGSRSIHLYLQRYFQTMGEAATQEYLPPDTVRAYLMESLAIGRLREALLRALALLLMTYVDPARSGRTVDAPGSNPLRAMEAALRNKEAWERLERDLPYYLLSSPAADQLRKLMEKIPGAMQLRSLLVSSRDDAQRAVEVEYHRCETERTRVEAALAGDIGGDKLEAAAATCRDLAETTRFELDRERLIELSGIANDAARYWGEKDYVEREAQAGQIEIRLSRFSEAVQRAPTKLSVEVLQGFARKLLSVVRQDFSGYREQARPIIDLSSPLIGDDHYVLSERRDLDVAVEVFLRPGSAPIERVRVRAVEDAGLLCPEPADIPERLQAGDRRQVQLRLVPADEMIRDQAFTLGVVVEYETRDGKKCTTEISTLPVRIGRREDFAAIPNPYEAYSGGSIVEDESMFFGRTALVDRIVRQVTTGAVGQCFVLYGQKRSGKSSVLRHVAKRVVPPCLSVSVTLGSLDTADVGQNFVELVVEELAAELGRTLQRECPVLVDPAALRDQPAAAFRRAISVAWDLLRSAGWECPRVVLLIDEFTYLFEYIREGIVERSFMRQWKGMLEAHLFSAVLVGQDSMPRFKQEFPNEFGVTRDERISYLAEPDARALAERPILSDGQTRYRGRALDRLLSLTSRSPFYMQIFCDQLVIHLNQRRARFVTEADIDAVCRRLSEGQSALTVERFDPLITAAGESVASAPRETYMAILTAIAKHSGARGGARAADLPDVPGREALLLDMIDREVVTLDAAGRYSICVQLFAAWLRVNRESA